MKKSKDKSKWKPLIWGRVPDHETHLLDERKWNKKDWAEYGVMFVFLVAAVVVLGLVGALLGGLIMRLWG